jgi:hypothetical protein
VTTLVAFTLLTAAACTRGPDALGTRQTVALGIRERDDGAEFTLPRGTEIELSLPASYQWTVEISDASIVRLLSTSTRGEVTVWSLEGLSRGLAKVRATGIPKCRTAPAACPDAERAFQVALRVE